MPQNQYISANPDLSKVLPVQRPARTPFDDQCPRLGVSELWIPEARAISGTGSNWRFRGFYNCFEARLSGNQAPVLLPMGNKGLQSLALGENGAGINNGSWWLPGIDLLAGKDDNSFFMTFFLYVRPADTAAGITAGAGTIVAEASADNAGMSLTIDATGRWIYDPKRESGTFALRVLPDVNGDIHGTIEVYGLEHDTTTGIVRLWRGASATPWAEATGVTEKIATGVLKWGSNNVTSNGSAATGMRITPAHCIPGKIAAADRAELMTTLSRLI